PVELVKCRTVDLEVPADAELVLEGELLPIGWTTDEGPFGEFSHITGDVKWNPVFRVKCITHRRDPIFYMLQMPWENDWLAAPAASTSIRASRRGRWARAGCRRRPSSASTRRFPRACRGASTSASATSRRTPSASRITCEIFCAGGPDMAPRPPALGRPPAGSRGGVSPLGS